ncbi:unnamed protein product [Acanthoscelides obtectus]|uniref:DUF7869 domain-containing protein n=1 Tax=Acanthoscelides obtectus TaxID=200917 RepID=A0A9P0NRW8_ACAOB|nr:unnamed protein product [Acanthoscelides obtectus]CAK1661297.1 hypothetical protein AOBTE_LOCUS22554 [Acanthoscelides obtectus]
MSNEGSITPKKDKRGKHKNRPNRTPAENLQSARDHINAIPKYTSHYSRKRNPGKVYINHDLNISKLYKDYYIDWCKERDLVHVSEDRYRRIFCTEYNIGFKLPKSDTCKTCGMLKIKIEDPGATTEEIKSDKIKLELHQRRAEAMQQSLKRETEYAKISGDTYVITFDLQQALPVPNLTVGPAFYLRKAWVYNLGIHDCVTGQGYMYMWPENVAKRGSDEIASILYKHFREHYIKGNKKLIVYTDNCGGQNKNWSIICLWQQLVVDGWFDSVEHRFLVVGHTHLPCDRDFALIEKYKKGMRQVYEPNDWYQAVQKTKRTNPFVVNVIKQKDIISFKYLLTQIQKRNVLDDKGKLNFSHVSHFKFCHEDPNKMYIKHAINEEFRSVTIKKRGIRHSISLRLKDLKRKYYQLLPLNNKKVSNLSELLKYIPPIYI